MQSKSCWGNYELALVRQDLQIHLAPFTESRGAGRFLRDGVSEKEYEVKVERIRQSFYYVGTIRLVYRPKPASTPKPKRKKAR